MTTSSPVLGLLLAATAGVGVHYMWTAAHGTRAIVPGGGLGRRVERRTFRDWMVQAGLGDVATSEFVAVVLVLFVVAGLLAFAIFGGIAAGVAVGVFAATFPPAAYRRRRASRLAKAQEAWPRMIEEVRILTGSLGRSIPQALFEVGRRGPVELRPAFAAAQREWLLSTDFDRKRWRSARHWGKAWRSIRQIRELSFDWVIDLQSLLRSGVVAWLANGSLTVGLDDPREGARGFYDVIVPRPSYDTHAVDWYLATLPPLGVPVHRGFTWLPARPRVAEAIISYRPLRTAGPCPSSAVEGQVLAFPIQSVSSDRRARCGATVSKSGCRGLAKQTPAPVALSCPS